jgi:hypothetical protein
MTSYIKLLNAIDGFCQQHLQIKKNAGEFREQMPNFSTLNEKYPLLFYVPISQTMGENTNIFAMDIYCVDIIQKDRANINTILSDTNLILNDLYLYFSQGSDLSIDAQAPTLIPVNNFDLDYVAGWQMSITFEVDQYCVNDIPFEIGD